MMNALNKKTDLKEKCLQLFTQSGDISNIWKCKKCGAECKKEKGTGWSNLDQHTKIHEKDARAANQQTLTSFCANSNMYGWLDWVGSDLRPFSFVDGQLTKKYSNLKPITRTTFVKYLHLVLKAVEEEISKTLPEKFALVIDGWTKKSTHFVAIFAAVPATSSSRGYDTILLFTAPE